MYKRLGKKQTANNDQWAEVWARITRIVSKAEIDRLVDQTCEEIARTVRGKTVAFGWSGGKDSQAIRGVCEMVGITPCLMAMSNLEYPAFLRWVTDQMPWDLSIINVGLDLPWLSKHPEMLFPQDSKTAAKWFKLIQHTAQEIYFKREKLDVLLVGRRKQDGNYMGRDGTGFYTNGKGITRYAPIRNWTHEQIMAFCVYYDYPLPPIYGWPNGWVVGTGAWAARQWTGSTENGWQEIWRIDKSLVIEAADYLPSARIFLEQKQALQRGLEEIRK